MQLEPVPPATRELFSADACAFDELVLSHEFAEFLTPLAYRHLE